MAFIVPTGLSSLCTDFADHKFAVAMVGRSARYRAMLALITAQSAIKLLSLIFPPVWAAGKQTIDVAAGWARRF